MPARQASLQQHADKSEVRLLQHMRYGQQDREPVYRRLAKALRTSPATLVTDAELDAKPTLDPASCAVCISFRLHVLSWDTDCKLGIVVRLTLRTLGVRVENETANVSSNGWMTFVSVLKSV